MLLILTLLVSSLSAAILGHRTLTLGCCLSALILSVLSQIAAAQPDS